MATGNTNSGIVLSANANFNLLQDNIASNQAIFHGIALFNAKEGASRNPSFVYQTSVHKRFLC